MLLLRTIHVSERLARETLEGIVRCVFNVFIASTKLPWRVFCEPGPPAT